MDLLPPPTATSEPNPTDLVQAALFSEFAEQPEMVPVAKLFLKTGKTTCRRTEWCNELIEAFCTGMYSKRQLAKKFQCGRETINTIIALADEAGKLGPLKERMSKKMGMVQELSLEVIFEKLQDGTIPANVLPIVFGVVSDKKAMLDGTVTLDAPGAGTEKRITAEDVRARFEALKRGAIDVQSTVLPKEKP